MRKILLFVLMIFSVFGSVTVAFASDGTTELISSLNIANAAVAICILGALAFAVELIVQLTKELPIIKRIPTKAYVIFVSLIISILALYTYAAIIALQVLWYYVVLTIFGAFVVAYISIFGWEQLKELYDRFVPSLTKAKEIATGSDSK